MVSENIKIALEAAEGLLEGIGANYIWEALKLPGYGIGVPGLEQIQGPGGIFGVGVDDVIIASAGGAYAVYGWKKKDKRKIAQGVGITLGLLLTKVFEAYGFGRIQAMAYTVSPYKSPYSVSPVHGKYVVTN